MDRRPLPLRHWGRRAAAVFGACFLAAAASSSALTSTVSRDQTPLPAGALRGPIERLRQYPTLSLATSEQRAAAVRLLAATRQATRPWRNPRAAAAGGFSMKLAHRLAADTTVRWFHSENHAYLEDDHYFDPQHIETLIYANAPGRPLVLIGVMFALARGMQGVSPGGPITRWHTHWVCARGNHRGVAPRRLVPAGDQRQVRQRDDAHLVHARSPQRVRGARARTRVVRGPAPTERLLPSRRSPRGASLSARKRGRPPGRPPCGFLPTALTPGEIGRDDS